MNANSCLLFLGMLLVALSIEECGKDYYNAQVEKCLLPPPALDGESYIGGHKQ